MSLDAVDQHNEGTDQQWCSEDNEVNLRRDAQVEQHTANQRTDEGAYARKAGRPASACAAHLGRVDFRAVRWEDTQQSGAEKEDHASNQYQKHRLRSNLREEEAKNEHED